MPAITEAKKTETNNKKFRLDQLLTRLYPQYSRSELTRYIKNKRILVNNRACQRPATLVTGDEEIIIKPEATEKSPVLLPGAEVPIICEDDQLLVINKPSGLASHGYPNHHEQNLSHHLMTITNGHLSDCAGPDRRGIVHRLDKYTTGLMVIAKTNEAHLKLAAQFKTQKKHLHRQYIALVWGKTKQSGTIDQPIGHHAKVFNKMRICTGGKTAVTHYKLLKTYTISTKKQHTTHLSLLKCRLETGRTHQIRLHLKHIGHPVAGDHLYYNSKKLLNTLTYPDIKNLLTSLNGQLLHACSLSIQHPKTRDIIGFYAPAPKNFKDILKTLEHHQNPLIKPPTQ